MLKNIIQSLFARGIVAVINLIVLVISAKYLGVSTRGEISIFILNISIVQVICSVYTGYSIVHFVPKYSFKKMLRDGVVFTLIFALLSNLIINFLEKQLSGYEWVAYLVSVLVILNTFNCTLLLGKENIGRYNLLSILQPLLLVSGIAFYTLVIHNYTVEAYIHPLIISFVIALVVSTLSILKYLRTSTGNNYDFTQLITDGFYFQAGILIYLFSSRISYYLLPDRATVGLYSSAVVLTESVLLIANGVAPVLISKVANSENKNQNAVTGLTFAKLSLLLSVFGILIMMLMPERFFTYLLGSGFVGVKPLMMAYAPSVIAMSFFIPLANFFTAIGKQKTTLICYSTGLLCTLIVAPLLIKSYGATGAAYTANLSALIMTVLMIILFFYNNQLSRKHIGIGKKDFIALKHLWQSNKKL
ncbi:MAG: polysaccharide biosynthesis C-terminal domain-containing protein [Bacteroidia bacterium]|nr:polysaccharide biosynthesis C-terminal domain-containing protein [Bacteroidia bacterium]